MSLFSPVELTENQPTPTKKHRQFWFGKKSECCPEMGLGLVSTSQHVQRSLTPVNLVSPSLFLVERRYGRKRLSQDQPKDDPGQQPDITVASPGLEGLVLPPEMPLIQPKTEPVEQESEEPVTESNAISAPSHFRDTMCLIAAIVSAVFAVQVKVEEMEMETPIQLPENSQLLHVGAIKQEGAEQSKAGATPAPRRSSSDDSARDRRERRDTAAGGGEELGSLEEGSAGETDQRESRSSSGGEESHKLNGEEGSRGDGSTVEEVSESSVEQDMT